MKQFRYFLWVLVFVFAGGLAYLYVNQDRPEDHGVASVGGPFELVTTKGTPITYDDLKGKPHAVFFGFTHCPEICPTSLFELTGWMQQLGPDADKLGAYFFTVDPERDTKEVLADYISAFDPRITGITGDPKKMEEAIKAYRIFARKVPLDDGDYTMDHTASIFLMDADGKFKGTIAYGENPDAAIEKLKRLVDAS